MGRGVASEPIDVAIVRASFTLRQDGRLCHASSKRSDHAGEPAGFMVGDRPMVRLSVGGKSRRIALLRAAWMIAHGAAPRGVVKPLDGDEWNAKAENLSLVPHCSHKPSEKGGRSSSLTHRAEADADLLRTMADNPDATVETLAQMTGVSRARASTRLTKLAARDLVISPMCIPNRSWMLTGRGREIAEAGEPLLDATDRAILSALSAASMGPARLARRCSVAEPTAARRARLLAVRGLLYADPRGFFQLTPVGRKALGESPPPPRWIDATRISAAVAKDVLARPVSDMSAAMRKQYSAAAAAKGRANRRTGQNAGAVLEADFEALKLAG